MSARARARSTCSDSAGCARAEVRAPRACHNRVTMKLLRMKPGHGEIVLAEGDVEVAEEEQALIEAFRRELDAGMWGRPCRRRRPTGDARRSW